MAQFFPALTPAHREFIATQRIFLVGSAPDQGRVNVSPKGMDTFRVLSDRRVGYLDATGSGNETAAHLLNNGRITIMMCSFTTTPLIFRIYGRGRTLRTGDSEWGELRPTFGPPLPGERQIIAIEIESIQTSCGFGVPFYDYQGERETLVDYATQKGAEGMAAYRAKNNSRSIDGLPTGMSDA